jgi:hypothetical protein
MPNANALLNYLKRIAQQQLMLRTQVFTKKNFSTKNVMATFLNQKYIIRYILNFAGFELGLSDYHALDFKNYSKSMSSYQIQS